MIIDLTRPFPSLEEAEAALRDTGVHTVTSRTKTDTAGEIQARLRKCAQFRQLKPRENPQRQGRSAGTGCPYQFWIRRRAGGWYFERTVGDKASQHNHPLADPASFARLRTPLVRRYKDDIIAMSNAGSGPTRILAQLRAKGDPVVEQFTAYDTSNAIQKYRKEDAEDDAKDDAKDDGKHIEDWDTLEMKPIWLEFLKFLKERYPKRYRALMEQKEC
ncbi:hypothetical protein IF1G_00575 [Cordyceps javanica]|uniref:Uncharacterized protein n=1 Tax=Cordyceps javanica TaxID=43265 RepID=A0A545WDA7_9HYPO|nr:hypothetical protein IF1G_00575 [Cordyceps javanica]TQW11825.1 FAR1 DNA-binding domain-containing protein [Cordyceps javanica]